MMREAFPFSIAHMPHLDSNIPSNIYYVSIGSEILRFATTQLDINTFVNTCQSYFKENAEIKK